MSGNPATWLVTGLPLTVDTHVNYVVLNLYRNSGSRNPSKWVVHASRTCDGLFISSKKEKYISWLTYILIGTFRPRKVGSSSDNRWMFVCIFTQVYFPKWILGIVFVHPPTYLPIHSATVWWVSIVLFSSQTWKRVLEVVRHTEMCLSWSEFRGFYFWNIYHSNWIADKGDIVVKRFLKEANASFRQLAQQSIGICWHTVFYCKHYWIRQK